MKKYFYLILLISSIAHAMGDEDRIIAAKTQAEEKISRDIISFLERRLPGEKLGVDVELEIKRGWFKRSSTEPSDLFDLPGLDASEYQPTVTPRKMPNWEEMLLATNQFKATIIATREMPLIEKQLIQNGIMKSLRFYPIKDFDFKYEVFTPAQTNNMQSFIQEAIEDGKEYFSSTGNALMQQAERISKIFSHTFIWGIVSGLVVLALVLSLISLFGLKKIEATTKSMMGEMKNSLANMSIHLSKDETETASEVTAKMNRASDDESYETIIAKIAGLFKSDAKDFFDVLNSLGDGKKMFVFLECFSEQREKWKEMLLSKTARHYQDFLLTLSESTSSREHLKSIALELYSDAMLFFHDQTLLRKRMLKTALLELSTRELSQLVKDANKKEFWMIVKMGDPIKTSGLIANEPHLIERFHNLDSVPIEASDINEFLNKLAGITQRYEERVLLQNHISEYLPYELEKKLRAVLGDEQTVWDSMSEKNIESLRAYVKGLNIDQISNFMAVIPQSSHDIVWNSLPEIKYQQLQRKGIVLTNESYKLKQKFLSKIRAAV